MKRFIYLFSTIVILVIMSACKDKSNSPQLRVGIIKPSINHLPLSLALEKGYLNRNMFRLVTFTSGWEVQEAITAGRIDLAIMPFTYAWTSVAKGYKLKIISCLERETDGILSKNRYVDVKELQSKKIGLLRASTLEVLMQDSAKKRGFDYQPVYFRTPTEMIAALQTDEVDAIVCYVPLIQKMGSDYHVLHWFSETYPSHPCCDFVATAQVASTRDKELKLILNSLSKTVSELANPNEEIYALLLSQYGLDRKQASEALQHTVFDVSLIESDKRFEQQMMEFFIDNSYIKKLPSLADVYLE